MIFNFSSLYKPHLQLLIPTMLLPLRVAFRLSLAANLAVLGLKGKVKPGEVKRKYYQLAKLYHPDVNKEDTNAQKKFTQLTKAYKYITHNYDQEQAQFQNPSSKKESPYGNASNFKNDKQQKTRAEEDTYQDFHEYDDFFKHSKKFRKPKLGEDIYLNISVTLQESVRGVEKELTYTRYEPCLDCATKSFSACFSCGGKGEIYDRVNRQKVRCEACSGKGFKNECLSCLGGSYVLKSVKHNIYVEKGTQDKSILQVDYKGHSGYKADNGHLYVTVSVEENNKFKMDGNNVHYQLELDFVTAACGGRIPIQTVHGTKEIQIEAGTQSGSQIRIFNAGLKSPYSKRMGDQIVRIKIKIPDRLTQKQRSLLRRLHEVEQAL